MKLGSFKEGLTERLSTKGWVGCRGIRGIARCRGPVPLGGESSHRTLKRPWVERCPSTPPASQKPPHGTWTHSPSSIQVSSWVSHWLNLTVSHGTHRCMPVWSLQLSLLPDSRDKGWKVSPEEQMKRTWHTYLKQVQVSLSGGWHRTSSYLDHLCPSFPLPTTPFNQEAPSLG